MPHIATTALTSGNSCRVLTDRRPEDPDFCESEGKRIATRNLWISVPNLLMAFSVWMLWSVVLSKMRAIGFDFTIGDGA